jgi:hypothetical protein
LFFAFFYIRPAVQLGLHLVQRVEKAFGGDHGAEAQDAEDVPAEHVPEGCIGPLHAQLHGLGLQLLRDPRHPDQGVDEECGDPQQIGRGISPGPSAQDPVQLRLQAAEGHIQQKKQPRREKVDKAQQKARPFGVLKSHGFSSAAFYLGRSGSSCQSSTGRTRAASPRMSRT